MTLLSLNLSVSRILRVSFNSSLFFKDYIKSVSHRCFFFVNLIIHLHSYFFQATSETTIHAFVPFLLYYCKFLFTGLPAFTLHPSHLAYAARLLYCSVKFTHLTPILSDLYCIKSSQSHISFLFFNNHFLSNHASFALPLIFFFHVSSLLF